MQYASAVQVILCVNKSLILFQNPVLSSENIRLRGMRTPSKASTKRPSMKAMPRMDRRKRTANGNPTIRTDSPSDRDTPTTAHVKNTMPMARERRR
jgi:hypothetical protein